jgi:hypothetical protein
MGGIMHTRIIRIGLLVLVATVALLAAACGGSPQSSKSGASAGGGSGSNQAASGTISIPSNLCGLISAANLTQIMGQSMPAPVLEAGGGAGGGEQDCQTTGETLVDFTLYAGPFCPNGPVTSQCLSDRSSAFAVNKQDVSKTQKLQSISGLGSQAYCGTYSVVGSPVAEVAVLKNWIFITTTADTCTQAQSVASLLLSKL